MRVCVCVCGGGGGGGGGAAGVEGKSTYVEVRLYMYNKLFVLYCNVMKRHEAVNIMYIID